MESDSFSTMPFHWVYKQHENVQYLSLLYNPTVDLHPQMLVKQEQAVGTGVVKYEAEKRFPAA